MSWRVRRAVCRVCVAVVAVAPSLVGLPPALAHPTRSFESCGYNRFSRTCTDNVTYAYGALVRLRGKVRPSHGSLAAEVWRQNPGSRQWRLVDDSVSISDNGSMRWSWRTTIDDADQERPYHFRFRIRGHGRSDVTEVWVIFGE